MAMNDKIRFDQVLYGSGTLGYGILATSIVDKEFANSAINVCLAVGQIPGSGLRAPVLLSRVLGGHIVMARLCNGARDPSGRNTLFVHALVGLVQDVRRAGVTTFTLADAGVFRDRLSGNSVEAIEVAANPPTTQPPAVSLELPAAIETSEPDEKLMKRIMAGRENELSWSTFAFENMPGYDIICISKFASRPSGRAIYDSSLRLLCHKLNGDKLDNGGVRSQSIPSGTVEDSQRTPPRSRDVGSAPGTKRKNKTFVALLVSIALNFVLVVVACRIRTGGTHEAQSGQDWEASLEREAIVTFPGDRRVTDEKLKVCGYPLQCLFLREGDVAEEKPEQVELFHRLLAYRDFVEKRIIKHRKEQ